MTRFAGFLLGALALDERGQRAIDAAMADWRHELNRASSLRRRLLVNIRSAMGLARTIARVGIAEATSAATCSFVWRLAVVAGLWLAWMLSNGVPPGTDRFFLVTSDLKSWSLVAASLLPQALLVLPVMVFLAEAAGRRRRATPVAGTMALLSMIVVVLGLVVVPLSSTYLRYQTWRYFANAAVPEPALNTLLLSAISIVSTMWGIAALCAILVFANRIRRVGGVTGWAIGVSTLATVYLVGVLMQFVPLVGVRIAVMLASPLLSLAAILWATTRLAKLEDVRKRASA